MEPKVIKQEELLIAGVSGDGNKTGEVWQQFIELEKKIGIKNKLSDNGYEVRIYNGDGCTCHVGVAVSDCDIDSAFTVLKLPASTYAAFEVYVARGYDSANEAMDQWVEANKDKYGERKLNGCHYVVEYYGERFKGDSEDSVVEIWIPVEEIT